MPVEIGQANSPSPTSSLPATPLRKGYVYVNEVDPTFSPSTVGKWAKSRTELYKTKNPRDLIASLEGMSLQAAEARMRETFGTVSAKVLREITKTLQLIVYQRYENQNLVLENHRQITKYLFSPCLGSANNDSDPIQSVQVISDAMCAFIDESTTVADQKRTPGMIQILCSRLLALTQLDEKLIQPSKKEAMNILLMYEFVFHLCASQRFIAHQPLEVFGYTTGTDVNVLQASSNKTYQYLLRHSEGRYVGDDFYSFTVNPHHWSLTIRKA